MTGGPKKMRNCSRQMSKEGRFHCYAQQAESVLSLGPETVLEVGVGAGVVSDMLRSRGLTVTTFDIRSETKPDIVASVTHIPLGRDMVDVTLCCQVLEHLPFNQFRSALVELRRVTRKGLVLSLPDRRWSFGVHLWFSRFRVSWNLSFFRRVQEKTIRQAWETSGHHWEIGRSGYSAGRVRSMIRSAGWDIDSNWRVPERPLHHMFCLRPQSLRCEEGSGGVAATTQQTVAENSKAHLDSTARGTSGGAIHGNK